MRIPCPICGDRDLREFSYMGHETYLNRPAADAPPEERDAYLHLRENPAGPTRDLWFHEAGCGSWLLIERDTTTHAITSAKLVSEAEA